MINKFTNGPDTVFRWDCESLLESSGNNLHLTGATASFRQVYENVIGLSPPVTVNRNGVSDAVLKDYSDLTIHLLLVIRATPSGSYIIAFQASGETEPTNYSWSVQLSNATTLAYFSEFGPGTDSSYFVSVAGRGLPAIGVPFLLTMRRKVVTGGVTVQFDINGVPYGPPSGVIPAPSGGTTAQLVFNQSGSVAADLFGVKIDDDFLTDAQVLASYNDTLGEHFGRLVPEVQSLWVGALTDDGATIAAQLTYASDDVVLVVTSPGGVVSTGSIAIAHGAAGKFVVSGLDPDTEHTYEVECDGDLAAGPVGTFRTLPTGDCSFSVAFAGDSFTASNAEVFDTIREMDPDMFLQLGDINYRNIATNDQAQFQAGLNENLAQFRQAQLYREIPTAYVWDDHVSGGNNHDGSAASVPAANAVYRLRVPHYALPSATAIYQTFDIGRVRFVVTDQRSAASANSATDNSSKTMLGAAQKTWFKNILSNSAGYLIVWVCPRWFGQVTTVGSDSWGGFNTERVELATYIHNNCPGRVIVLSADLHAIGIDNGSHHDFVVGGGEPLRCFQAAPLDVPVPVSSGTYSEGMFATNGVFGTMDVEDMGISGLDITWRALDTSGMELTSLAFTVSL